MEMDYKFKADLNGWLAHEQKHVQYRQDPKEFEQSFENLLDTFTKTLEYYKKSDHALASLHRILFQALMRQNDYKTDFDIPYFEKGVDLELFYKISLHFNLFRYTCYELWTIPTRDAIEFIVNVSQYAKQPLRVYHATFIKLAQLFDPTQSADLEFNQWLASQLKLDREATSYKYTLVQRLYECFVENKQNKNLASTIRLLEILKCLLADMDTGSADIKFQLGNIYDLYHSNVDLDWLSSYITDREKLFAHTQLKTCKDQRKEQHSLKYNWEEMLTRDIGVSTREKTFMVICDHIKNQAFPGSWLEQVDSEQVAKLSKLETVIDTTDEEYNDYKQCKLWCCFVIKHTCTFYKSVLKVVVQFIDLWIDQIQSADCLDVFVRLIKKENLALVLYDNIQKHVRQFNITGDEAFFLKIKNLCGLLEQSMEQTEDLFILRDTIYEEREGNQSASLPTFGSIDLWNVPFETKLTKVSNQITSLNEEEDEELVRNIIKEVCMLSVIWPYEVVRVLFLACVNNANQYKAIVPVFRKLGKLCRLSKRGTNEDPLLILVMKDYMSQNERSGQENIIQFIQHCFCEEFNQDFPLILLPESRADQFFELLNFKELMNNFVQFYMCIDACQEYGFSIASQCLTSFCGQWRTDCIDKSDPPAIIGLLSASTLICLNGCILFGQEVQVKDLEKIYDFIKRYCQIISITGYFPENVIKFYNFMNLNEYEWLQKIMWIEFIQAVEMHLGSVQPIGIPDSMLKLTGGLNDHFYGIEDEDYDADSSHGWINLFHACKYSTEMTDALFEDNGLIEIIDYIFVNTPKNNRIIRDYARQVLDPVVQPTIPIYYENILNYFMSKLYRRFQSPHLVKIVKYDPPKVRVFVDRLDDTGETSYFLLAHILELLKQGIGISTPYHTAQLIKVIQGLANWGEISNAGQVDSYKYLKEKVSNQAVENEETLVYYPILNTEELKSNRAFSVIVFYQLCLLSTKYKDEESKDIIYRLAMQVLEGLVDNKSRQQFQKMIQLQPKNRRTTWKKRPSRVFLQMRPILLEDESELILPVVKRKGFKQSDDLLQILTAPTNEQQQQQQQLYII